jgi:hypothetical protein
MSERTIIRLVSVVIAVVGVAILLNSTVWGLRQFGAVVRALDGLSGEARNQIATFGPVVAYRLLGAILLGVGLWRALEASPRQ